MRELARIYVQRLRRFIRSSHREDEPTEWNLKTYKRVLREGEALDWVFPAPKLASVSRGEFVRLFRGAVSTPMRASAVAPGLEGDEEDFFGLGAAEVGEGDWDCLFSDSDEEA